MLWKEETTKRIKLNDIRLYMRSREKRENKKNDFTKCVCRN